MPGPTLPDLPADEIAIRIRGLVNRFGTHAVHENLDLDVRRGEILGVVGGSGTGKSVLLRSIIGLTRASAGTVEVLGQTIGSLDDAARRALERRWGVLFQGGALFSSLTVGQNVAVPLKEGTDLPADIVEGLAQLKVAMAGLPPEACTKYPAELSGGMVKRAGLARALALDPELLFLDEPTAGLDPIAAANFDQLLLDLRRTLGFTVFLVTHDLDTLVTVCDRIAVLAERRVIVVGTMDELLRETHPWIVEYFHGPRARAARREG